MVFFSLSLSFSHESTFKCRRGKTERQSSHYALNLFHLLQNEMYDYVLSYKSAFHRCTIFEMAATQLRQKRTNTRNQIYINGTDNNVNWSDEWNWKWTFFLLYGPCTHQRDSHTHMERYRRFCMAARFDIAACTSSWTITNSFPKCIWNHWHESQTRAFLACFSLFFYFVANIKHIFSYKRCCE